MPSYKRQWLFSLCLAGVILTPAAARADNIEKRDYAVLVDGREAGQSHMVFTVKEDGTTLVTATAKVQATVWLIPYSYAIDEKEEWKDGKLVSLQSTSSENSKKNDVQVTADGPELRVRVNGQERRLRGDVWTTSFWRLADARYHNNPVPLLDPETGKDYNGQLQYIATEQLTVGKESQSCYHFRVTGVPQPVDVWFDRYYRLVRQEFSELGVRTIMQLQSISQ